MLTPLLPNIELAPVLEEFDFEGQPITRDEAEQVRRVIRELRKAEVPEEAPP